MAGKRKDFINKRRKKKKSCCGKKLTTSQVYQHLPLLELINRVRQPKLKSKLLDLAGPHAIDSASSICRNIIAGNLKIKNPSLRKTVCEKRRLDMEALAAANTPYRRKKNILIGPRRGQRGGFLSLLATLIPAAISVIGSLFSGN